MLKLVKGHEWNNLIMNYVEAGRVINVIMLKLLCYSGILLLYIYSIYIVHVK